MNHGSLFSGIGGFDIASEWMGWTNQFHCEWNPFGQKVLKYYWPEAESYSDITKTDFSIWRGKIDILTGGFPCQPYSTAGKRLGKEDERHLWPEMLRAIREIQPRYVVGENVSGLVNWNAGMVFDEVQADLEAEGYEVRPFILPACAVNAPHRRDRVWFISRLISNTSHPRWNGIDKESSKGFLSKSEGISFNESNSLYGTGITSYSHSLRHRGGNIQPESNQPKEQPLDQNEQQHRYGVRGKIEGCGRISSDTDSIGLRGQSDWAGKPGFFGKNSTGNYWRDFPTQSPICSGNDGISSRLDRITFPQWRKESIKAGGNAIVPQVAYQIFQAINEFEKQYGYQEN